MSIEAMVAARKLKLPPRDKFVLIALADFANDRGWAWPKQSTLAEWTCYGRDTVNAALQALEREHGLIESHQRRYDDGRQASKRYRLTFVTHADSASADAPKTAGDSPVGVSRVGEADTDHVGEADTDHVGEADNKNPQRRSRNVEPPRKSSALARRSDLAGCEEAVAVYNAHRGALPEVQAVNDARRRRWKTVAREFETPDLALEALRLATLQVASDPFWVEKPYGFDNLLVQGRVQAKAEVQAQRGGMSGSDTRTAATAKDILEAIWEG